MVYTYTYYVLVTFREFEKLMPILYDQNTSRKPLRIKDIKNYWCV